MSEEVTEGMELPVSCAHLCSKSQLPGNGDPEAKPETQENEQNTLITDSDTSQNSRSENYHEQIVVSAGRMQMQLVDTPDSEVTETDLQNDDLMSTQFVSTAGSEKSYPDHAGIFSAKSNSSVTQGQAVTLKGRQPVIKNVAIPSVGESHVSHDNDIILEQFTLTGNKIENFLMSASSYETSAARSLQLTSQMCSLPRQMKIRTDLSLNDKVRLIQVSEKTGKSQRSLAAEFGISLGSVNNILRRKREYIEAFERNEVSGSIKSFRRISWPSCSRTRSPVPKVSETDSLNRLMYKWVETAKKKNVILSSTLLQDKASEFASKLGISSFTPTNSWVNTLKNQFNLCFENDNDSTGKLYTTWTKMLPYLIQGYEPQNVFTCGETTLIYKGLPDKCLVEGGMCMGTHHRTKSSNHSVTLLLCCSAVGEKIKPLVIGKSGMRNSFQNVAPGNLPVVWKHQDKACMTSSLFTEWLKDLDRRMEQQNRHIALFMDMAPGHLSNLLLRNVRLQFYLDNSSSYLQPLQQGILTSFKAHYRKRFLQAVLAWAECCDSSPHVVNNVTELDVVFWIKHAWNSVKKGLVINCFDAVGFPTPPPVVEEDTNDGLSLQLSELVEECGQAFKFTPMHAKMYVEFDSQIPCHVHETELWEQQLLAEAMTGSITIKSEPVEEDFQYGGRARLPLDGQSSQTEGTTVARPISQSEALESLNKLKTFAASDPSLLETLYATEEEMLESISSHRQQARCRAMNNLFPLNVYQHGIL